MAEFQRRGWTALLTCCFLVPALVAGAGMMYLTGNFGAAFGAFGVAMLMMMAVLFL